MYRIYLALQLFYGYTGTYYVVLKLCKAHQLMPKKKHHAKGLTKADPAAQASENLIQQDFSASAPNQKWLGDITEIPTMEGKLYVSAVLDCYDGAIVGFKMYRETLARHGALQSMSHTGKCYDNARMESFFATLKMEVVKSMVFRFIEIHYNRKRIYTTNDGYPPLMKRGQYYRDQLSKVV